MKRNLIYFTILIILTFTLSMTTIESFNSAIGQVDPSQDPIQPIPPSNTTNTNQTSPIIISQYPAL
jgi:zona occludens toxin (predicted ATPase)